MIPIKLMIHSVSIYSISKNDYGVETETMIGTLQEARIEPRAEGVSNANGVDVRWSATLFVNFYEENVPEIGMIVKWAVGNETVRYRVQRVDRLYGRSGLSHYEVRLSDG